MRDMKETGWNAFAGLAAVICFGYATCAAEDSAAYRHGMVATVNPVATEAGVAVLKNGGNAVDATVAVALTLGVVDGYNSGIGGGCFMLIRRPDGTFVAIDGRETAPGRATRDMFVRNAKADTRLSQTGALASGVPGELAACEYAVSHYGKKKLSELLLPAAEIADRGVVVSRRYAAVLKSVANEMTEFDSSRAVFCTHGKFVEQGTMLKQPDLAQSYHQIAEGGIDWFYRGPFAQAVEKWMSGHGGIMTAQDFANYQVKLREPIITTYRGYQLVSFPPPSSGGVHVAEIMNILENFDLAKMGAVTRFHVMAEAMKLAFADRAYWLGDPDFAKVPRGLVDKAYAAELAHRIDMNHVIKVDSHGMPPDWQTNVFQKHTTHFSVADSEGNWVACTATVNTSFGSKVVIPGTGVVMNNQMDDFSAQPGVANYFGLIGAEANAVQAGKRPLSSMSPTIVLKDRQPVISLGAAGGPKIITQVVMELVGTLDLGMSPQQALAQPRIHHQWSPDELFVEPTLSLDMQVALEKLGHRLNVTAGSGISQIVGWDTQKNRFVGAADPRGDGQAAGW
jgi:gamma-glutamyltranspeptidase/glutathione hydrolase